VQIEAQFIALSHDTVGMLGKERFRLGTEQSAVDLGKPDVVLRVVA
jgi:hypothetical protein